MTERSPLERLKRTLKQYDDFTDNEFQTHYFFFEQLEAIKKMPIILNNIFDDKQLNLITNDKELEIYINSHHLKNVTENDRSYIVYDISYAEDKEQFFKNMHCLYGFSDVLKQANVMILVPPQYAPEMSSFYHYTHRTATYSEMDQEVINEVNIIKMKEKLDQELKVVKNSSASKVKI